MVKIWGAFGLVFLLFVDKSQCLLSTSLSPESDDEHFNETMEAVVNMTQEVDRLIGILSKPGLKGLESSGEPVSFFFGFGDIIAIAELGFTIKDHYDRIKKEKEDAAAAEQQQILDDYRFKELTKQNDALLYKVTEVRNAVDAGADKIINGMNEAADKIVDAIEKALAKQEALRVKTEWDDKVKLPMYELLYHYNIMLKTMNEGDSMRLKNICEKYPPTEITSILSFLIRPMYHALLNNNYDDENYLAVFDFENQILSQFGVVFPFCSILMDGPIGNNDTIADRIKSVKAALDASKEASDDANKFRDSHIWENLEIFVRLYDANYDPTENYTVNAEKLYQATLTEFRHLREPISNEEYVYHITMSQAFDEVDGMVVKGFVFHGQTVRSNNNLADFYVTEKPKKTAKCNFEINEFHGLTPQLEEEFCHLRDINQDEPTEGVLKFLQTYCKFSLITTFSYVFNSTSNMAGYSGDELFQTFHVICVNETEQRDVYVYYI